MKIFVISLKRSHERRQSISAQLQRLGLPFEFVDAVDGRDLDDNIVREQLTSDFYTSYKNEPWLTEGVVGAALSHRKVHKRMIDEDIPYAMILEDDVIFSDHFLSVYNNLTPLLSEDRLISFFFQSSIKKDLLEFKKSTRIRIDDQHALYQPKSLRNFGSAAAYILSKKVAAKMHEYQQPIRGCPDWWHGYSNNRIFEDIRLVFPLVLKPGEFASTINYQKGDTIIRLVRSIIDRIPLFRLIIGKRRSDRFELYQNYKFS